MDYIISEPENKLIKFGPKVVEEIRKEYNIDNNANREQALTMIQEWVKSQEHFVKKDFSKPYIERCLITCKGSLELTKKKLDKLCTFKTLLPKYFETTNILESDIASLLDRELYAILPTLTEEHHRVVIVKVKPMDTKNVNFTAFFKFLVVMAEYFANTDYCRGFTLINDIYDSSTADILTKINLYELQQFLPILTEGYGCKIKGIIFLTGSKFIDGFVKLVKPLFSEKIGARLHVATSIEGLKEFLPVDILPEEYGGKAQSIQILHDNLVQTFTSKSHQELMKEMNGARTDESKRRLDKFNEQYMGMPGSFRTLSLD